MAGGKAVALDRSGIGKGNIDKWMAEMNKKLGAGSVMRLAESKKVQVRWIPTGIAVLDAMMGGGIPRGRVVEIYGPESSTKTTVALHAVAEVLRAGGYVLFVDFEHALDPKYAKNLGADKDHPNFLVSQPDTAEQGLELASEAAESGLFDLIVIDSVAAMSPRAEVEGEMGDAMVGVVARLMSQAMRKLTGALGRSGGEDGAGGYNPPRTGAVFVNQIRERVGVMFGNPETTPGGRALKFAASIRLEVRKQSEARKDGEEQIANQIKAKTVKNKLASPFRTCEYFVYYGVGIDNMDGLIAVATDKMPNSRLTKRGANFYLDGDKTPIAKSKDALRTYFKQNAAVYDEIKETIAQFLANQDELVELEDIVKVEPTEEEVAEANLDQSHDPDAVELETAPPAPVTTGGKPLAFSLDSKGGQPF